MALNFLKLFRNKTSLPAVLSSVDSQYAEASRAYESKDLEQAIALFDQVVAIKPDHAQAFYKRGNALKDLGRFSAAVESYDRAVACMPDLAHAWCNRGVVLQRLSLSEAALLSYDRAIELDPGDALVHVNRGALLQTLSRGEAALASYDRALVLDPKLFAIWFHRGNLLRELGRSDAALASYRTAIALNSDHSEAHYNCGVLHEQARRFPEAIASYDRAITLSPGFYQAVYNRAGVFKQLDDKEAALAGYDAVIAVKDDYVDAHLNRGVMLQELGRLEQALASYDRAVALRPDYAEAYFNRGTVFKALRQWKAALVTFDLAIALRPDYAEVLCDRAGVRIELGNLRDALIDYDRAVELKPDFAEAHYNRALAQLMNGDFENGWVNYEWRWRNSTRLSLAEERTFAEPLWLGVESLAGKTLLVHAEQGLGDVLQFCRYTKLLAEKGATVLLEVYTPLVELLSWLDGVSRVITAGHELPAFDYQCPLMSLPLALKTTVDTVPASAGYLKADKTRVSEWRQRLASRTRPLVGLVWSGNPANAVDHQRSIRLADWLPYLPPEFVYVSLQKDVRESDREALESSAAIETYADQLRNFADTAALCDTLDLVISVETSVAHLSAALGKPTWVLLPFRPDWRWLLARDDSPWYSTAKLYRQQAPDNWQEVFARVADDLRQASVTRDFTRRAATLPSVAGR